MASNYTPIPNEAPTQEQAKRALLWMLDTDYIEESEGAKLAAEILAGVVARSPYAKVLTLHRDDVAQQLVEKYQVPRKIAMIRTAAMTDEDLRELAETVGSNDAMMDQYWMTVDAALEECPELTGEVGDPSEPGHPDNPRSEY
jgi:hypothetical protein